MPELHPLDSTEQQLSHKENLSIFLLNSFMKKIFLIFLFFNFVFLYPQPTHKIMSYNALNYPGSTATERNPYFATVISNANPDILVMQEMTSQTGVNGFLTNVLIPINSNYTAGTFLDGPDTDNAIFFKSDLFTFISNTAISTTLRNISEFKLVYKSTNDTLRIYSVHLKASTGSTNEQQRLAEVTLLRNITDALPSNKNYLVCGDFNFYGSTEPAYQKLLDQTTTGYFIDLVNLTGIWNNSAYALYHTQSTRIRQFGGGATGGMDDRFDMILFSQALVDSGGITYVPNTYSAYGNDGLHYNDSINRPPNIAVGQQIADALEYTSDHLPVIASFKFVAITSVQNVSDNIPDKFVLYQNYPNPFNPITTISYDLPTNDFVTLKIYDVLGNEITTLIKEEQRAGFHKIDFNATSLSSGMYLYSLQSNNKTLTNKMIFIK